MKAMVVLAVVMSVVGCSHELDVGAPGGVDDSLNGAPADGEPVVVANPTVRDDDNDGDSSSDNGDGTTDDGVVGPDEQAPPDVDLPPEAPGASPPPAETSQTCTVWQDCAPHFGDRNSGFDCDNGQCACNVADGYDEACAEIGGFWSDDECFCFVTQSRPPEPANDDEDDEDAPYCWWRWREECDADEWVDTSYSERVCTNGTCRNVWRNDGYWAEGACTEVWTKRCDDGSQYVYRI